MKTTDYIPRPCHQRGAVLFISLIILLVITLIGITAMQSTSLEEKMAGNLRSNKMTYEAAEAALSEGESDLRLPLFCLKPKLQNDSGNKDKSCGGSNLWIWRLNGPHPDASADIPDSVLTDIYNPWWTNRNPSWWELRDSAWWKCAPPCVKDGNEDSHSYSFSNPLYGLGQQPPLYLFEYAGWIDSPRQWCDYSEPCQIKDYYRITARGSTGDNNQTIIILQSVFAWRYGSTIK
jgi:Tfp pilus assembly protein PilX